MGICVICQNFFYSGDWPENKIFLEDSKWKRLWKANSYKSGNLRRQIILDAKELEGKYFKNKHDIRHWCALFRVIWYDEVEGRFRLSGIGQYNMNSTYGRLNTTAKEYEQALIGRVKESDNSEKMKKANTGIITKYYTSQQLSWWSYINERGLPNGHDAKIVSADWSSLPLAMHMSCWKLAQWVLGPSLLDYDNNLELFAGIVLDFGIRQSWIWYEKDALINLDLSMDPYRMPEIQQLIARSKEEKKKKKQRRPKGDPQSYWISRLPIEVLEMTLDHLTVLEMVKLEKILSIVIVGERYWRYRASWDLVEADELAGEEDQIDWRYLCVKLDKMIRRDKAFHNRNHVIRVLQDHIEPEFLRRLDEGDHLSVKQVIVEYQQKKAKITGWYV